MTEKNPTLLTFDLGCFLLLVSYLDTSVQAGILSNMNLFVLVSEGENNFNLLNSRDPLKYSNKTFL